MNHKCTAVPKKNAPPLRTQVICSAAAVALALACGEAPQGQASQQLASESVGEVEQFVFWNPASSLVTEHVNWHTRDRSSSNRGQEFMTFHRNYLERLRDNFESQGLTHNIDPWYSLPAAIKATSYWQARAASLQAAEDNIVNLRTSATATPTLDQFGVYLEDFYHGALHYAAEEAYGGSQGCTTANSDCIVDTLMSPQSTYFFKIHGLVDWHLERFLRGDFNRDGKADLLTRNAGDGSVQIRLHNGTTLSQIVFTRTAERDSCNWYTGATADFTMDGWTDIVWHGPGCNSVHVWAMNGTTYSKTMVLPGVDTAWTLVGAGDFTKDNRPDLVWQNKTSGEINIWRMNGTNYVNSIVIPFALSTGQVSLVADFNDNGSPDLLLRKNNSSGVTYDLQLMSGTSFSTKSAITGLSTSPYHSPAGVGRYATDRYVDIVMLHDVPAPSPQLYHSFAMKGSGNSVSMTAAQYTGGNIYARGPR